MSLNLKNVADKLDEIAALFTALGSDFRDAAEAGGDSAGNGKTAKPGVRAGSPAKVAKGTEAAELTDDDVREALKELVATKGKETMIAALESVGAAKLAEVDESQYQELMDKIEELKDEPEGEPAPAKGKAKPAAKKAAAKKAPTVTLDDLTEAAKLLIDADKPAYLKIAKKFGKPSEIEEDQYGPMLEAIQAAMPEDNDDLL